MLFEKHKSHKTQLKIELKQDYIYLLGVIAFRTYLTFILAGKMKKERNQKIINCGSFSYIQITKDSYNL